MTSRSTLSAVLALVLTAALAVTGCTNTAGAAALVNGVPVKSDELQRQLDQMKKASPQMFEGTEGKARELEYKAKILESLIQAELVTQAAKTLGVTVTDKQVTDYITQLEGQYGGKTGLDDAMKQAGITAEQLKVSIRSRLLYDAVRSKVTKQAKVTDEEARAYYDKNPAAFTSQAQVHAAHILVPSSDKALAEKLFAQVKGGADIAALAKANSTDPGSKDKGGDLGWAAPSAYVVEFAKAVGEMKAGEVRLVQSAQLGWHIIKLLETKPAAVQPFESVKPQIIGFLQQEGRSEEFTRYIADLEKKAKVEILDAELRKAMEASPTVSPVAP
jgi:parvulin-like peptidyl-prolyl isomerase